MEIILKSQIEILEFTGTIRAEQHIWAGSRINEFKGRSTEIMQFWKHKEKSMQESELSLRLVGHYQQ